jgi:hypothetical protein
LATASADRRKRLLLGYSGDGRSSFLDVTAEPFDNEGQWSERDALATAAEAPPFSAIALLLAAV